LGFLINSPHKFRHGHAVYSLKQANTITDLKAISQNLSHASIKTTDQIYSILSEDDVKERIAGFGQGSIMRLEHNQDEKLQKIWKILNE
jgi:integrase